MADQLPSLLTSAKSLILQNNYPKCDLLIKKALFQYPQNSELLHLRSFLFRKKGQYEDALQDLETAYKNLSPKNPLESDIRNQIGLTYNEMGMGLFSKERFQEAITIFTEALKFREDDWGILMNRGDTHIKLNSYQKGLADYLIGLKKTNMIEVTTRIAYVYSLLGLEKFNKKEYIEAIKFFGKAIGYQKDCSGYYLIRGKCFYEMNDLKNACDDFEKAVELDQGNQEAKNYLGVIKKPMNKKLRHIIYHEEDGLE